MSAWIEMFGGLGAFSLKLVALLVSAWIEINKPPCDGTLTTVALLVSAWIEIKAKKTMTSWQVKSHSL